MMALILKEHANDPDIDILKVIKMGLIHDIVEIDAGDTFIYDDSLKENKYKSEKAAAERILACCRPNKKMNWYPYGRNSKPGRHRRQSSRRQWTGWAR